MPDSRAAAVSGYWEATFEGRTEVVDSALAEMLHQIDRMRTELVPDSEITNTKGFLVGSFPLTIETPEQIASAVATARLLGLGADYVRLYRERLAAVTPARARAAAARTYHRSALSIVVVGDGEKLYDRLKAIAPVRIVDVDGKPLTPDDLHPKTGAPALDRAQIVTRADSFQIVIQGTPNGSLTSQTTVSGDSIVYQERTVIAGGMVQQGTTVHFNPTDLSVTQVDQTGRVQGQPADIHLTYGAGRVKGKSTTPQPGGASQTLDIDTTVDAGYLRRQRAQSHHPRPAPGRRPEPGAERVRVGQGRDRGHAGQGVRRRQRDRARRHFPDVPARHHRGAGADGVLRHQGHPAPHREDRAGRRALRLRAGEMSPTMREIHPMRAMWILVAAPCRGLCQASARPAVQTPAPRQRSSRRPAHSGRSTPRPTGVTRIRPC